MGFLRTFPTEKPYNAYLIRVQRPEASFTATASRWTQSYRGIVRAGSRPMVVLRPFGPVGFVYDILDIDGHWIPEAAWRPFHATGSASPRAYRLLIEHAATELVSVERVTTPPTEAGLIRPLAPGRVKMPSQTLQPDLSGLVPRTPTPWAAYTVEINAAFDDATALTTLLHELAHLLLGHLERPPHHEGHRSAVPPHRPGLSHGVVELEAESVAFLSAGRLGLEDRSAQYLAPFFQEGVSGREFRGLNFDAVLRAATRLETWCQVPPRRRRAKAAVAPEWGTP